jgi:Na+/citrate or Na+/malate symporter
MDNRLYFVLGDLFANLLTGAVAGALCALLIVQGWPMVPAMCLAMILGMAVGLVLFFPLGIYFGAMEVMLPIMFGGMVSGMVMGMWAAMTPVAMVQGLLWGGLCGLLSLSFVWVLNAVLRGPREFAGED